MLAGLRYGDTQVQELMYGDSFVQKMYKGDTLLWQRPASIYEPEYQAVLNRATALGYTLPPDDVKTRDNNILKEWKAAGAFQRLNAFYVMKYPAGCESFATLNWVNPLQYQGSRVNSLPLVSNKGFKPTPGDNSYLDLGFKLNALSKYTQNSATRGAWVFENTSTSVSDSIIDGEISGTGNCMFAMNLAAQRINQGSTNLPSTADFSGTGLKMLCRNNTTVTAVNNATKQTFTIASSAPSDITQALFKRDNSVTANASVVGLSAYWVGSDLTDLADTIKTIMTKYMVDVIVRESEYQSVINAATSNGYALPTDYELVKQNDLLIGLKNIDAFRRMDAFVLFNVQTAQDFAMINWKNPANVFTRNNSPIFESGSGFRSDGVNAYISTNFSLSALTNYSQNSASRMAWVYSTQATDVNNSAIDGELTSSGNSMFNLNTPPQRVNQGGATMPVSVDLSGTGMKMLCRADASSVYAFNNGVASAKINSASSAIPNLPFALFKRNNAGPGQIGLSGLSAYAIGSNMSDIAPQLNTLLTNYFAS